MVYEAVKVKLDPTPSQIRAFKSHVGAARFAYNACYSAIEKIKDTEDSIYISGRNIRDLIWMKIRDEVAPWHKENSKESYVNACFNLAQAYQNFFDGCSGKRKDKPGYPKFKKKSNYGSYTLSTGYFKVEGKRVYLSKLGWVHCFEDLEKRINNLKMKSCTVSTDGDNWFASILVETDYPEYTDHLSGFVGIDLGLKELATLSNGAVYETFKPYRDQEKRLKRYQRICSRKQGHRKGEKKSKRYLKACKRRRKLERKIANQRRDRIEKITTDICKTYKNIAIEDLKVSNMQKNHYLAKSFKDASLSMFRACLERKAEKFNNHIYVIDTYYPSSKTCSRCGEVKAKLDLSERTYICEHCGHEIDRDLNAAINLEQVARNTQETINAHGEHIRPVSLSEIGSCLMKRESGIEIRPEVLSSNTKNPLKTFNIKVVVV